jgi:putative ABC transport system permease protein
MFTATIKGMLAHKLRLVLTSASIALGIAFLAGTLMLTDSMHRAFDDVFAKANSGTDVAVRAEASSIGGDAAHKPIPASLVRTVRSVDGVAAAEGQVSGGYAMLVGPDGKPIQPPGGAPTWGGSLPQDKGLRGDVRINTGRAPAKADEVVIDASSAKNAAIPLGSRIKILFQGPAEQFTVVGTVQFAGKDDLGGTTAALFEPATAQRVIGKAGFYDSIAVRAVHGVSNETLAKRIDATLPKGVEALTGQAVAAEQSNMIKQDLGILNTSLLVFAGIALFVGSFIIWNTFSMQVAQRTRELALLRAIGATRRQVMRAILLEALVQGLGASVLGLFLGLGVARGLSWTMSLFGMELPTATPRLQGTTVLAALLVGTLVTLVAAIAPSRRATRVLPMEALRDSTPGAERFSKRRLVIGLAVTGVGVAALGAGLGGAPPWLILVGIVAAVLGVTTLAPLFAGPLASLLGHPLRSRGVPGELARQNAMRNPKRTASTAMALVIGLALVSSVTVLAASIKASVHDILGKEATAELYVKPDDNQAPGLSREVAKSVGDVDGVAVVSQSGFGRAKFTGQLTSFASIDPRTVEQVLSVGMEAGKPRDLTDGGVLVSKAKADANHWKVGDSVPAEFAQTGTKNLRIDGIFSRKGYFDADYLISLGAHDEQDSRRLDSTVFVKTAAGADADAVQKRVSTALAAHPGTKVLNQKELQKESDGEIDLLLNLIIVMLLLAVVIALLGIVNTLALSVFERTRELGLLRAVGMTRGQVRAMVRWESVIISVIGASMGAVLGIGLGASFVKALADQGFGSMAVPGKQLLLYVALAAVAGVIAAIGPARRAAKVDVLRAVVTE